MADHLAAICTRERVFADDVAGQCSRCLTVVYYRPHVEQSGVKVRYCMECFERIATPMTTMRLTRQSFAEIALWLATLKQRAH